MHKEGEESDEDDDDDDDESEETALESYETPLDKEDCDIEEYQIFKTVLESKLKHKHFEMQPVRWLIFD